MKKSIIMTVILLTRLDPLYMFVIMLTMVLFVRQSFLLTVIKSNCVMMEFLMKTSTFLLMSYLSPDFFMIWVIKPDAIPVDLSQITSPHKPFFGSTKKDITA